jgi:hypothetical protein
MLVARGLDFHGVTGDSKSMGVTTNPGRLFLIFEDGLRGQMNGMIADGNLNAGILKIRELLEDFRQS